MSKSRDRWSSRMIFIFAAVGSAVGLGNVWRFPYLAGKYGGGAFLIPYLTILFVLGIPLLIMEFALGQKMQQGAIGAFKKIDKKLSGIGLSTILSGFIVDAYYAVVIAWSVLYIVHSFTLRWGADPKTFFFSQVLHLSEGAGQMGYITAPVLFCLVLTWVLIYFSIWKGVKSVGKVIMVTMPLPIILLFILFLRGITLPGAMTGIVYYLKPNFVAIFDVDVWIAAMSQIFYTLTLAFGAMIAYASFKEEKSDIAKNAIIAALMNSSISILAGFAVFSTLGYMALQQGTPVAELAASGPSLAFIVFPKALSLIPMAPVFAVLFFIMLLTLGIDSAFSLVEGLTTVIHDRYPQIRREDIALHVCVIGLICGILFTTQAGLYYLDITDHFITTYGLVFAGLLEVLAVGWIYGAEKLRTVINEVSEIKLGYWWTLFIKYLIPVMLIVLLTTSLINDLSSPYEGYPQWALFAFGWMIIILLFGSSLIYSLTRK